MKRLIYFFAVIAVIVMAMPARAHAEEYFGQLPFLVDTADILTDDEETVLINKAESISEKYKIGVFILAIPDFTQEGYNQYDAFEMLDEVRADFDLGYGTSGGTGDVIILIKFVHPFCKSKCLIYTMRFIIIHLSWIHMPIKFRD